MGKVKGNISLNYRCMNRKSNLWKLWPHCVIVHSTGIACHGAIIFNITILTLSVVTADCVSYDCFLWLIWYLFNHFVTFHSIWLSIQILHIIFNQQCFLSTAVLKGYIPSSNYYFRSMYVLISKKRTESDILANIFHMYLGIYFFQKCTNQLVVCTLL